MKDMELRDVVTALRLRITILEANQSCYQQDIQALLRHLGLKIVNQPTRVVEAAAQVVPRQVLEGLGQTINRNLGSLQKEDEECSGMTP